MKPKNFDPENPSSWGGLATGKEKEWMAAPISPDDTEEDEMARHISDRVGYDAEDSDREEKD